MQSHKTAKNLDVHPLAEDDGRAVVSLREIGATTDTAATDDTGNFTLIALVKRLVGKLPASLGQKSAAASLPVVMASDQSPRATSVASIPNGASVSGTVDLLSTALLAFIVPTAWTAAALNIEVSMTGGGNASEWVTAGLYDASSTASGNYPSLTPGAAYAVDTLTLLPFRYVRLRSGTLASPVNQAAQRDFTLITRPLA